MKQTVYIETSVVSYLTARPTRDIITAGHQKITLEWWGRSRPVYECCISPFVIEEISRGDSVAIQKRMDAVSDMHILEVNTEVMSLAALYHRHLEIPEKAKADSYHMAIATVHEIDYILTWNCRHIANGRIIRRVEELNRKKGIRTPVICTPEELMEA